VVTWISTVPVPGGLKAVQLEPSSVQAIPVAAFGPKVIAVAAARFAPEIVTEVAPEASPLAGDTDVMEGPPPTGGGATYVNKSAGELALCSPFTTTRTSTVPEPGGVFAVHELTVEHVIEIARFVPTKICVAPGARLNPLPVTVKAVPPAIGPLVGLMLVTVGGVGAAATRQICP